MFSRREQLGPVREHLGLVREQLGPLKEYFVLWHTSAFFLAASFTKNGALQQKPIGIQAVRINSSKNNK
jgi:hypothetical protein